MKKLDSFIKKRRDIAKYYLSKIKNENIILPTYENELSSSYHLFIIRKLTNRNEFFSFLRESNIFCQLHYIPIYRHPFYKKLGYDPNNFSNSESYYDQALSIPIHQKLSESQMNYIVEVINNYDK